jgi:hypothetical protein
MGRVRTADIEILMNRIRPKHRADITHKPFARMNGDADVIGCLWLSFDIFRLHFISSRSSWYNCINWLQRAASQQRPAIETISNDTRMV